ncbi:MAG: DNA-binding protein [Burkholderiaceae bacterium]|nr:DNA-binding protein [Burkholderiaceae bacterium]
MDPLTDDLPKLPKNLEQFKANGQSIAQWARSMNFNPRLVYAVLRGERKCHRGQSHEIAKELGMK